MAKRTGGFIGQDGINAPDQATGVTGTAGDTSVSVAFTAPSDVGGAAITGYNVQAADGSGTWQSSYDIGTASYDNVSVSVSAQGVAPCGIFFKPDGTKMYIIEEVSSNVNEYNLSTAWDITTASYSQSFSVATQETGPQALFFKPDGTKMYITGYIGDDVNEYNLSTAWDVSTASFGQSFSVAAKETVPEGLSFKSDGTKMYVLGSSSDSIHEYNLSSAWDVSTASFGQSFSVASEDPNPNDLFFKPDGLSFYVIGYNGDEVNEYSLSSAWDVSTASYVQNFSFASQDSAPRDIFFNPDGTKMFMLGSSAKAVYQYTSGLSDYPTASPVTVTGLTNGTSYTFNVWAINPFGWSSPSDASGSVSPVAPRGIFAGGFSASDIATDVIQYIQISSTGNATDFGDLSVSRTYSAGGSSATRGVSIAGISGSFVLQNVIDYVTIASTGNATDFGDTTEALLPNEDAGAANSTRCLYTGRNPSIINKIEYITIASTGNGLDFGDLTSNRDPAGAASPTRAVFFCGGNPSTNVIDYVTIASTGNAIDFGNATTTYSQGGAISSETRALNIGGVNGSLQSSIDYITIASTGNASDFGDLTVARRYGTGCSSSTRGVFGGGNTSSNTYSDIMDYVTIATTGNATDYGDLATGSQGNCGFSSAHGGLS